MRTRFENARLVRLLILFAFLLLGSSACATQTPEPFDGPPADPRFTALLVVNGALWDVEIYQSDGGVSWRLGRVTALGSARLRLRTQAGGVRLVLRSFASADVVPLEEVWLTPGSRLELSIAPRLERSALVADPTAR